VTRHRERRLVVNADDLGLSAGVNRGIAEAVERGIVTSVSLMVRGPDAAGAARWARAHPHVSTGLHVDIGEWAFRDGAWAPLYQVVDPEDAAAVSDELSHQLRMFLHLLGRPPTHLDSHQHAHRAQPLRSCLAHAGERLGVTVREMSGSVAYCGEFYGQDGRGQPYHSGITFEALLGVFDRLPEGTTELSCHPGSDDLSEIDSMYVSERAIERAVLCDQRVRPALAARGIQLRSFAALT